MTGTKKTTKTVIVIVVMLFAAAGGYAAVRAALELPAIATMLGLKPDMHKIIVETADKLNKGYPKMVDSVTRLEKIVPGDGNALSYNFTVTEDISITEAIVSSLREAVTTNYCTSEPMKFFRDAGTKISWVYHDKSGQPLNTITVTPDLCK